MTLIAALGRHAGFSSKTSYGFGVMLELYRQRRALARLEDTALVDLGLTRQEADAEAKRPAWDVPAAWRC